MCVEPQPLLSRKNVLEFLYHHAKFGRARTSNAAGGTKNVEFFARLPICPFVRHAVERQSLRERLRPEDIRT